MGETKPGDLVMQWFPIVDAAGHAHMEARWSVVPETTAPPQSTPRPAPHAVHAA